MPRIVRTVLLALAVAGWIVLFYRATQTIASYASGPEINTVYLHDWRVHYAGALDFLERDLYLDGEIAVGGLEMPIDVFNLPPLAAIVALPFLPFGYFVGGLLWTVCGAVAMVTAGVLAVRFVGMSRPMVILGLLWLGYVLQPWFVSNVALGNVNGLMLLIVVGFAWAHLAGRQRLAGVLLGLAVAIKVWPLLLGVLLLRERRWLELCWAGAVLAIQGILVIAWLGEDVLPAIVGAMRTFVPIPYGVMLLWTTWARESFAWWPDWGALVVAAILLAIPARGMLGLGLGMLAGLSIIANVWDHYLPTFVFALTLIVLSPEAKAAASRWARRVKVVRPNAVSGSSP